jgi:hypothetical protein
MLARYNTFSEFLYATCKNEVQILLPFGRCMDVSVDQITIMCDALARNTSLRWLSIKSIRMMDINATFFQKELSNLFRRNTNINTLDLPRAYSSHEELFALAETVLSSSTSIRSLTLHYTTTQICDRPECNGFLLALRASSTLTYLDMKSIRMSNSAQSYLMELIRSNALTLNALHLGILCNDQNVYANLASNTSLTSFSSSISHARDGWSSVFDGLAQLLICNETLESLVIYYNNSPGIARSIRYRVKRLLNYNTSLIALTLADTYFDYDYHCLDAAENSTPQVFVKRENLLRWRSIKSLLNKV